MLFGSRHKSTNKCPNIVVRFFMNYHFIMYEANIGDKNLKKDLLNVLFSDLKGFVKRLDRICKFWRLDNEKAGDCTFILDG